MKLKKINTNRGFRRLEFKDGYGAPCILQKSSAATADYIWFGMLNWPGPHHVTHEQPSATMHLDRKAVKKLLPILQHFVDTGELP